ncbi:MAG: hypothetical protein M0Q51_03995 [Bacteroidales bacterium]|nr:hypothetical protein [Bacteroidales bacterium]
MKTQNIILSLIIMLLLAFSACREITVTTKVNPDGTFTRIITVTGDSSDVFKTDLPFPVNETWEQKSSKNPSDSTKYMVTYTKSFRNSDDLKTEIKGDTSEYRNLDRDISVTKRFRFFFSYLTFNEVYKSANPFNKLDYRDYLTEDDILWVNDQKIPVSEADSTRKEEAEDKFSVFLTKSAVAEVESVLQDGIKRLNNPQLNPVDLSIYYDSLYKNMEGLNFMNGIDFIDLYRKWSGNEAFSLLDDLEPPLFEDFAKKLKMLETIIELEGYTEEVEMPGLITNTNSAMLNGNQVGWEFQFGYVLISDFEMYAESRVINYWVFILAGLVLLALVIILVIKAVR